MHIDMPLALVTARGLLLLLWGSLSAVGLLAFRWRFFRALVLQGRLRSPAAVAQLPRLSLLRLEVSALSLSLSL